MLTVESRYPVDIVGKQALFEILFGIHLPQYEIKTKAEEFKLPRIPAIHCPLTSGPQQLASGYAPEPRNVIQELSIHTS